MSDDRPGVDPTTSPTYIDLAKISQTSFHNRREYEWKVAFGFWTAIGLFTYFCIEHAGSLKDLTWWIFGFYILIWLLWVFLWQWPLRLAFEEDKAYLLYYMHRAENRPAIWRPDISYEDNVPNGNAASDGWDAWWNSVKQPFSRCCPEICRTFVRWFCPGLCRDIWRLRRRPNEAGKLNVSWRAVAWSAGQPIFTLVILIGSWCVIKTAFDDAKNGVPADMQHSVQSGENNVTTTTTISARTATVNGVEPSPNKTSADAARQ